MPDIKQALRDLVATSNSGIYKSENELLSKFPELSGFDKQSLRDYVATSNSKYYKTEDELNSKFPEFFDVKKKETSEVGGEIYAPPQKNTVPLSGKLESEFIPSKSVAADFIPKGTQTEESKTLKTDVEAAQQIDLKTAQQKIDAYRSKDYPSLNEAEQYREYSNALKVKERIEKGIKSKVKPVIRETIDRMKPTIEAQTDKKLAYETLERQLSKRYDATAVKEALTEYQQGDIEKKAATLIKSRGIKDITYMPDRYIDEVKEYLRGEGYKDEAVENAMSTITNQASNFELTTQGMKALKDEAKSTAQKLGTPITEKEENDYIMQKAVDETHTFFGEQELEKMQKQMQLNKLIDNPNKTIEDRVKINKLQKEILEKYPNDVRMYNANGEAYTDQQKTAQIQSLESEYKVSFKDKLKEGFLEKYAAYKQALNNHNKISNDVQSKDTGAITDLQRSELLARVDKSSDVLDKAQMEYIAMSKLYLLNESAANVDKGLGFYASTFAKAAAESFLSTVGGKEAAKKLPKTDRDLLNNIDKVMSDYDIKKSPIEAEKIEQGLLEMTTTATGSVLGILPVLAAANKAQALSGLTGIIGRLTAATRTVKTAEGLYKVEANPVFSKIIGHALGAIVEDVKMGAALDSDMGVGAGFYMGAKAGFGIPMKGKYSAILKPYIDKFVGGSIGGTVGMETGEISKELAGALFQDKDLDYRLKELYPNMDVFGKRVISNLISNSLLGVTHFNKMDVTTNPEVLKKMSLETKKEAYELRKQGDEKGALAQEQLAELYDSKAKMLQPKDDLKEIPRAPYSDITKVIKVEAPKEEKPTYRINNKEVTKEEVIKYAEENKDKVDTERIEISNDTETIKEVETILTKIDDAVGRDVDYNGVDGVLVKEPDGFYVLGDNGEKTLVESGESGKSITDLGIKVYKRTPQEEIDLAVKESEHIGETNYNGKNYFIATSVPIPSGERVDKVFLLDNDGNIVREVFTDKRADLNKKNAIINKMVTEKGLPKREAVKVEVKKELEQPSVVSETKLVETPILEEQKQPSIKDVASPEEGLAENVPVKPEVIEKETITPTETPKEVGQEVGQDVQAENTEPTGKESLQVAPDTKDVSNAEVADNIDVNSTKKVEEPIQRVGDIFTFNDKEYEITGFTKEGLPIFAETLVSINKKRDNPVSTPPAEISTPVSDVSTPVEENPALKDVEATAEALEGVDISKIEDKVGGIVYHGTSYDIEKPTIEKYGQVHEMGGMLGKAVYYTPSKSEAEYFADLSLNKNKSGVKKIISGVLKAKNIISVSDLIKQVSDDVLNKWIKDSNKYQGSASDLKKRADIESSEKSLTSYLSNIGDISELARMNGNDAVTWGYEGRGVNEIAIVDDSLVETNKQKIISEAYHKAKADGSNPELVKAVEDLLGTERGGETVIEGQPDKGTSKKETVTDRNVQTYEQEKVDKKTEAQLQKDVDNAISNLDLVKKKHKIYFNKKGELKTNEIPPETKKELKQAYDNSINTIKNLRQYKVENDKRDTGLVDGINAIRDNTNAFSLVKNTIERNLIPDRQLNDFGKNLIHTLYKKGIDQTAEVVEIIQDFIKRANVKTDDTFSRELQEIENKKFEELSNENLLLKNEPITIVIDTETLEKGKAKMASAIEKAMAKSRKLKEVTGGEDYKWKDIIKEFADGLSDVTTVASKEFIKELKKEFRKYVELTPEMIKKIYAEIDKMQTSLVAAYKDKKAEIGLKLAKETELKKSKDIIDEEIKNVKSQIRSQRRGAVNLKNEFNRIIKERKKDLDNLGITPMHTTTLINKIVGDGSKAIEWFDKLIADKDYANDYKVAKEIQGAIIEHIKKGNLSDLARIRGEKLASYDVSELSKEHLKEFVNDMNSILKSGKDLAEKIALSFEKTSSLKELNIETPEESTIEKVTKIKDLLNDKYDIGTMLAKRVENMGKKNLPVTPYNIVNEYLKLVDAKINKISKLASENGYVYDYTTKEFMKYDAEKGMLVIDKEMSDIAREYETLIGESKNYEKAIEKFNASSDSKISKEDYEAVLNDTKKAVIKNITNIKDSINLNKLLTDEHKKLGLKLKVISKETLEKMTPRQLQIMEKAVSDMAFQNVTKTTYEALREANVVNTKEKIQAPLNRLKDSVLGKKWRTKEFRKYTVDELVKMMSVRSISQMDAVWNTYLTDNNDVNFKKALKILMGSDPNVTNKGLYSEIYRPLAKALTDYYKFQANYYETLDQDVFVGKLGSLQKLTKGDFDALLKSSGLSNKSVSKVGILATQVDYYNNDVLKNTHPTELRNLIEKGKEVDADTYSDSKWVNDVTFHTTDVTQLKSQYVKDRRTALDMTILDDKGDRTLHKAYDELIEANKGGLGDIMTDAQALALLTPQERKLYNFHRDLMNYNIGKADAVATMQGLPLRERDSYAARFAVDNSFKAENYLEDFVRGLPSMKSGNVITRKDFGIKKYDANIIRNMDKWMTDMGKNFFLAPAISEVRKNIESLKENSTPADRKFLNILSDAMMRDFENRIRTEFSTERKGTAISWVANKTSLYTLARVARIPAETISNFLQHPVTNIGYTLSAISKGELKQEYSNMEIIADIYGSYTFTKEVDASKYLDKVEATSEKKQTWAGEIMQDTLITMVTVSDRLVRPLLFTATVHQMFEAKTGERFDSGKFLKDSAYKVKYEKLIKDIIEDADVSIQDNYMDYYKSFQSYEVKLPFTTKTLDKFSNKGRMATWLSSFPMKQAIRQIDATKSLISGTKEEKLKATRTIAAIQLQNTVYCATVRAAANALTLAISKATGNKDEEEYALKGLKEIASGRFWMENILGGVVSAPISQYGTFAKWILGGAFAGYKVLQYDTRGMNKYQKRKVLDEANEFSSALLGYGIKAPNIMLENEEKDFVEFGESIPAVGALAKMGYDIFGAGREVWQIGNEKYSATKELQKDVAINQGIIGAAMLINMFARTSMIPREAMDAIDREIRADKKEIQRKKKLYQ